MILQDGEIILELTEDRKYLTELMLRNKYTILNERGVEKFLKYVRYVWVGRASGMLGGVLFFCFYPELNRWTFDAYKEDDKLKVLDNKGDFSYKSGRLVVNWFFECKVSDKLFTMHDQKNRGATLVCKRLGFKPVECTGDFLTLSRGA